MSLIVFGINHDSAPLEVREHYALNESDYEIHIKKIICHADISAAVILSTCNRTEFYLAVSDTANDDQLFEYILPSAQLENNYFYQFKKQSCVRHLFSVVAGTDSLIVGETQIQGQVKTAYEVARSIHTLSSELNKLFQMAFKAAKLVRSSTEIGKNPVSIAHCAVQLSEQIFGRLKHQNILVIGAGETAELVIRYLMNHDGGSITVVNRTYEKAEYLADQFELRSLKFNHLYHDLAHYDLVFSATSAVEPIVSYDMAERALSQRKMKPMVMIDLAVPRDIDPDINRLEDVFLYTVDDLKSVIVENMNKRKSTLQEANRIIDSEVNIYHQWAQRLEYHNLLREFRESFMDKKDQIVASYRTGDATIDSRMEQLAHQLTNRMLHTPISRMRQLLEAGNKDDIHLIADLFDLKTHHDT